MADYTLEERLAYAREQRRAAEAAVNAANALRGRARDMGGGLLSFGGSGSQRAAQKVRSSTDRGLRAWAEANDRVEHWDMKISSLEQRIAERDRPRFTREDLAGAVVIRDPLGWRKVLKVNAKSVTVVSKLLPTWTDLVPFEKVLEVRR